MTWIPSGKDGRSVEQHYHEQHETVRKWAVEAGGEAGEGEGSIGKKLKIGRIR